MIYELNCYYHNKKHEKVFYGIKVEPTEDLNDAVRQAKEQVDWGRPVYAVGYYVNGGCQDAGSEYKLMSRICLNRL
jgi:hypothetical protein